jgi:hypothetical protein
MLHNNQINMMKIMKKTANSTMKLFIILFVFANLNVLAQKRNTSLEFSVHAGGGFDAFVFKPSSKDVSSAGYGGEIGGGFAGFFSPQVGIYVGAGFSMANIKSKVSSLKHVTPGLTQSDGWLYDLHTTLNGYTEVQKMMFINIPVMFQFQTKHKQYWNWKQNKNIGFYAMGGVKVSFLVSNKYDAMVSTLYNAAYFPELDNWADTHTFAGLGYFEGNSTSGDLDFGIMATLALETGVKWRIDRNVFLYTGVYFDYGLNDPFKDSRAPYSNFTSQKQLADLTLLKFADRASLLAVGVKVRVAFLRAL